MRKVSDGVWRPRTPVSMGFSARLLEGVFRRGSKERADMGARRLVYWWGLSLAVLSLGRGAVATPVVRLLYVDPPGSSIDAGARSFGLSEPRGMLVCGVQGCGKSLVSKAAARVLSLPLVRLDFAEVFSAPSAEH